MKKIIIFLAVVLVVCFLLPQVALASWWNPFTWHWNIFSIFFQPRNNTAQISGPVAMQVVPDVNKEITNNQQAIYKTNEAESVNAANNNRQEDSVAPSSIPVEQVKPEPAMSVEQRKATKIVSISDNLGNVFQMNCDWSETHYECYPKKDKEVSVSVKSNPQITFIVNAQDPNNRPLTYKICSNIGCCETPSGDSNWTNNSVCTIDLTKMLFGQNVFTFDVKNDDNYGSVGLDADSALYYKISE